MGEGGWDFWIDRGGTFTDIVARSPGGKLITHKLLSSSPGHYDDAAMSGIRRVLGLSAEDTIPDGLVRTVKIGTTVATNALLERTGEPSLLVVNVGFADALVIGNQARPRLFDLHVCRPAPLHHEVVELRGRVDVHGMQIEPLDEPAARAAFAEAHARGITTCAIALMHSWKFPRLEQRLAGLAAEAGFTQISASHAVSPLLRLIPRAETAVVDAYLSPILRRYVDQVAGELDRVRLFFMQSNGGLAEAAHFHGKDAILSGPAGGIVGAVRTAALAGIDRVIGFDMGGTSTDVALYAGSFERSFETEVAAVRLRAPMLAIHTVAAGGGSILQFDGARLRVGPDSAGADPGPACYRQGGPLTITDANLLAGKLQPRHFPAIFGPDGNQPLDVGIVRERFADLASEIEAATGQQQAPQAVAEGFIRIAVANMANAVKTVSVQKGHDASRFTLQCFGGAGGQHACLVADQLGIDTVFIHPLAGVLSAYGMGLADQTVMREQAVEQPLAVEAMPGLRALAERLSQDARAELLAQGAEPGHLVTRQFVHLRYAGAAAALPVPLDDEAALARSFAEAHRNRFGFATPERPLVVETVAVEVISPGEQAHEAPLPPRTGGVPEPIDSVTIWTAGRAQTAPVFDRDNLFPDDSVSGPALIREANTTTMVEPGWTAFVTSLNHMLLRRTVTRGSVVAVQSDRPDPVLLELFSNLFMNIAEQAGMVLRNTASSVNIKERLDFSCAIFDADGALIANAPHVPVHLGAMGESVRTVLSRRGASLRPGDMIALNNPYEGGTHLPDVTVIAPVFDPAGQEIRFFVGARGHHADIGGITPGSTPPSSTTLEQEGIVIDDFLVLRDGCFREAEFRALLTQSNNPARSPDVNVADLQAQIAANEKAVRELTEVVGHHGWAMVRAYMRHVMDNAEASVRAILGQVEDGRMDYRMDDGSLLCVAVHIDRAARTALIDFTGTGPQRGDNFNTPAAVVRAVVLYVFRCLVGSDIPLNDGCLRPIEIRLPAGTFLSPRPGAAVVAGNTEVSQAICNALLGALGVVAASQATMNNFLFGNAAHQYYETICGGTGAGPMFDGADAIHSHMTNTRMTDPEVLELRYPVRLEEFAIRRGSGGAGRHHGGDGARRRIRFLEPMTAVIVASRRTVAPFGLQGGDDGKPGQQWIEKHDGEVRMLSNAASAEMEAGDVFVIETPGDGGYGA